MSDGDLGALLFMQVTVGGMAFVLTSIAVATLLQYLSDAWEQK